MSRKTLYFVYDGPALASHEMDVRSLAPSLLALSDLFEEANTILNGDRARVSVNVKGSFKTGCFGFDLSVVQDMLQSLLNIAKDSNIQSASTIASLLGFGVGVVTGVLQVIKWVKGRKIDRIEVNGSIAIIHIGKEIKTVLKSEAAFFIAPKPMPEDLGTIEYDTTLQIVGVTFQEKNKWRFSDGISNTFYADMLDTDFLGRIDSHTILFGKGDIIRAKVREQKTLDAAGTMRAGRAIMQVYEHRNAAVQLKLTDDF